MEQQQQPETVGLSTVQSPPTFINVIPLSIPLAPIIPIQCVSQMPPLGPAPAQLPPLVHPPIPPPQSVINTNVTMQESVIPIQTQFETLSLHTPLEPIPPLSILNDLPLQQQEQFTSVLNPTHESVDGNPIDVNAAVNPADESSLVAEEGKRGMYLEYILINRILNIFT
jgi:hypothetical protein